MGNRLYLPHLRLLGLACDRQQNGGRCVGGYLLKDSMPTLPYSVRYTSNSAWHSGQNGTFMASGRIRKPGRFIRLWQRWFPHPMPWQERLVVGIGLGRFSVSIYRFVPNAPPPPPGEWHLYPPGGQPEQGITHQTDEREQE